jgi:hypothetical protein
VGGNENFEKTKLGNINKLGKTNGQHEKHEKNAKMKYLRTQNWEK